MAKSYIDIVKYMVEARFEISGSVEKPDIIGAIFGQTEGLLGGDLDLRELQKNGKIGRIEIESSGSGNRTFGKIFLPSSLPRVETCILAAAIESVDRVGPFETNVSVLKIEDTRSEKRRKIINRAKELVKTLLTTEIPDSREISEVVEADVKSSTVSTYGPESLPAGPDIDKNDEIVLVEGRADVINLLRNDIANCIAVGGAAGTIPKTILSLCTAKEATLFVDGDRGGEMIIKNITNMADIDFVAKAPDGKEVEELTRKEIIKALRARIPIEQILEQSKQRQERQERNDHFRGRGFHQRPQTNDRLPEHQPQRREILSPSEITTNLQSRQHNAAEPAASEGRSEMETHPELGIKDINGSEESTSIDIPNIEGEPAPHLQPHKAYIDSLSELHNTLRSRLYSADGSLIQEIPIRELIQTVQNAQGVNTVVFDGIITQRLVDLAHERGIKEMYGIKASQLSRKYPDLVLYTAEGGA
ncbi:MAG: DNA primase DnaG [Candidatus Marsarchaeota archaeon]|nr:DNA primase DnaG [Candidatus Marsarchaeota archaeon]MCL5115112.1 DNA primase DnaG [Candidatus Marsarchaeota archaeon]